jgi:hypothetical protein
MCKNMQPTKESIRRWLLDELRQRRPPPAPDQIRRAVGWPEPRQRLP